MVSLIALTECPINAQSTGTPVTSISNTVRRLSNNNRVLAFNAVDPATWRKTQVSRGAARAGNRGAGTDWGRTKDLSL